MAASQPNLVVYMVPMPQSYGSEGQQQMQMPDMDVEVKHSQTFGEDSSETCSGDTCSGDDDGTISLCSWTTDQGDLRDQSQYGNQFGSQQVFVPMQADSSGGQTMPVQQMRDQSDEQTWTTGAWQELPQQLQQWTGGWTIQSQSGIMPPQGNDMMQQMTSNMMQQGNQNSSMQAAGQQQHQPQVNMQQQQPFHMQQQQPLQFVMPQQLQQGNMQKQQPHQQITQQPQSDPRYAQSEKETSPSEPSSSAHESPAPVSASLSAKPKKKGLVNKPIAKAQQAPGVEQAQEQIVQDPMVESLREQLARAMRACESYEAMFKLISEDRCVLEERSKKAELERNSLLQELLNSRLQVFELLSKQSVEMEDKLSLLTARLLTAEDEKKTLRSQSEDQHKCVICLDVFPDHVLIPCGHLAVCKSCSVAAATECPVCRQPVEAIIQVFKP